MSDQEPAATPARDDPQALAATIERLAALAGENLDRNDLGRLAQIHTLCQDVDNWTGLGETQRRLAGAIADAAEAVILNDAADAQASLVLIAEGIRCLRERGSGEDAAEMAQRLRDSLRPHAVTAGEPRETGGPPPRFPTTSRASSDPAEFETYVSEPLLVDLADREHLQGFIEESREHMDAIETALLEVERDPANTVRINELFRPFHTIKGIAGFLHLRDINRLAHEAETLLDLGRRGEMAVTPAIVNLILNAVDVLKTQIENLSSYLDAPQGEVVPQPEIAEIVHALRRAAQRPPREAATELSAAPLSAPTGVQPVGHGMAGDPSIRVDTHKLDTLVDAVGELVIAQGMLHLDEAIRGSEKLSRLAAQVSKYVREIQGIALTLRMAPVGPIFQKMRRLVRDVAQRSGKQVELVIGGEETELDKTVIQQISDPLVHMVRNAVDHGLERPAERLCAGKPACGRVSLQARHQGDSIIIEIRDDGRGLDRARLLQRARERGLVRAGESLTEQQAYGLIFTPGFSTADTITEISGRGVGMDVVKANIEQLRGRIEIATEPGRGTTFRIHLPLTLAIIDGMLVGVGRHRMVIPTIVIEHSLRPAKQAVKTVRRRGQVLHSRDELVPLIQLGPLLGLGDASDPAEALVVILRAEGRRVGLVVDELIGQQHVVIKPLCDRFKGVRGICGAAILGDGRVGLILEPRGLLALHAEWQCDPAGVAQLHETRA